MSGQIGPVEALPESNRAETRSIREPRFLLPGYHPSCSRLELLLCQRFGLVAKKSLMNSSISPNT
jgi:hypothetical protein